MLNTNDNVHYIIGKLKKDTQENIEKLLNWVNFPCLNAELRLCFLDYYNSREYKLQLGKKLI